MQTPGDGEGQERLEGCSPWGCKESDTIERLNGTEKIRMEFKKEHSHPATTGHTLCSTLEGSTHPGNKLRHRTAEKELEDKLLLFSCSVMSDSFATPRTVA